MAHAELDRHSPAKIRYIPLSYNNADSQTSALRIVLALFPQWQNTDGKIEFVRFTDGITNTLLKAINKRPGMSEEEIDNEAVLLRAYGKGTDLIIDRERETQNHELLMQHGLAPVLLARFNNGMLYRFIRGAVTSPADLRVEGIWRAVARRLAQWHAVVPCLPSSAGSAPADANGESQAEKRSVRQSTIDNVAPGKLVPNVWSVMQKWIFALPTSAEAERKRQAVLQEELTRLVDELNGRPGLGENSVCRLTSPFRLLTVH
jgi:ethanolamine kinase